VHEPDLRTRLVDWFLRESRPGRPALTRCRRAVVLAPGMGIDEELHFATVLEDRRPYLMLFESDRFGANPYTAT